MDRTALQFEPHRRRLLALAYRMLGSRADAEDVVQDAWLRWRGARREEVDHPAAFLSRVATRLCLDRMKSAQAQREVYVGTWLPEPLVDELDGFQPEPPAAHELASDLSFAFLLLLERLSPLERAAFLLHDVFDMPFGDIAVTLGRSEAACRQLATRARKKIKAARPVLALAPESGARLAAAFVSAAREGDVASLAKVLADDVVLLTDGGGRVAAVPQAVVGSALVAQVVVGFTGKLVTDAATVRPARINGLPGLVVSAQGRLIQTLAFEVGGTGRIQAIYVMRNPDKLLHVTP